MRSAFTKKTPIVVAVYVLVALMFIAVALLVRGYQLSTLTWLNPDEAELMVDGRAAMLSPVPFSTWMTSTIGPVWVLTLAAIGGLGFPLTIASAHFLAAVFYGLFGFGTLILLRRTFGLRVALPLTVAWWVPLALGVPVGSASDFGAMTTELLPCLFVLGAALIPIRSLAARPWLFAVVGFLCSLAILSKYQVLPLAVSLVLFQLISIGTPWRTLIRPALMALAGVFAPVVILAIVMALSPSFSFELVVQNYRFLAAYGHVDLLVRLYFAVNILTGPYTLLVALVVAFLGLLSSRRVLLARVVVFGGGLAAVLIGGNPYGHYLMFLYVAAVIAAGLPIESNAISAGRIKLAIGIGASVALAAGLVGFAVGTHTVGIATPSVIGAAASRDSVVVNERLAEICPPDSSAVVWGFAPEIYLNNSLRNAIPIINAVQVINAPANYDSGLEIVRDAIVSPDTRCVVDAVGDGYFPSTPLTVVYPTLEIELSRLYREVPNVLDCDECTVYVRK